MPRDSPCQRRSGAYNHGMTLEDLFPKPPRPAHLPFVTLDRWLAEAWRLFDEVPLTRLTGEWKAKLGAYLFSGGTLVVYQVARALRGAPARFPDVPVDAQAMIDGTTRARKWRMLARLYRALADRAEQHAALEQAAAVKEAVQVIAHVRGPRHGFPGPDHELRRVALAAAEHALAALGPGRKGRRARR